MTNQISPTQARAGDPVRTTDVARRWIDRFDTDWRLLALLAGISIVAVFHIFRVLSVENCFVMPDEVIYRVLSKIIFNPGPSDTHFWLSLSSIPNGLYLATYHVCSFFGQNAYVAAKVLNVLFFCCACIVIFGVASRVTSRNWALFISLVTCISPLAAHTTYFMPESMYFFLFWVSVYFLTGMVFAERPWLQACLCGASMGLLFLTKPHALAVLIGVNLILILTALMARASRDRAFSPAAFFRRLLAVNLCFAAVVGVVGFFVVLRSGGSFVGAYSEVAASMFSFSALSDTIVKGAFISSGHLAYLAVIYALPLTCIIAGLGLAWRREERDVPRLFLGVACLLLLFVPLAMTVKFGIDYPNELNRLHGRYYNFALPLLLIGFYAFQQRLDQFSERGQRYFRAVLIALAILVPLGALAVARTRRPPVYDFPDVYWFSRDNLTLCAIAAISSLVLLYWGLRRRARTFLYSAALVFFGLAGTVIVARHQHSNSLARVDARAVATTINSLLPDNEKDLGVIVSADPQVAVYLEFYLEGLVRHRTVPESGVIDRSVVPADAKWLVLLNDYKLNLPFINAIQRPGFWFARLVPGYPVVAEAGEGATIQLQPSAGQRSLAGASSAYFTLPSQGDGSAGTTAFSLAGVSRPISLFRVQLRVGSDVGKGPTIVKVWAGGQDVLRIRPLITEIPSDGLLHSVYFRGDQIPGLTAKTTALSLDLAGRDGVRRKADYVSAGIPTDPWTCPLDDPFSWAATRLQFDDPVNGAGAASLRVTEPDPQLTQDFGQAPIQAMPGDRLVVRYRVTSRDNPAPPENQLGCLYFGVPEVGSTRTH